MNKAQPILGIVGCGHRAIVGFIQSLKAVGKAESVVALCDVNAARLEMAREVLSRPSCAIYRDFDALLKHPELNTVIVTTPDHMHVDFVTAALGAGKNVVCEKPMATTLDDARAMLRARGERDLRIAFNLRYSNVSRRVKEMILAGAVGRILHVEARDIIGWPHGSDYFRRWHRLRAKSGGLIIHKSTHIFDVLNWWLDDRPAAVEAWGGRQFYTADKQKGERCLTCTARAECPFHVDLEEDVPGQFAGIDHFYKRMYIDGEPLDGYRRDVCVFHAENDIPDTYHVQARYPKGARMSYTAIFYAPYEDRRIVLQGDTGRMEISKRRREIVVYRDNREDGRDVITLPNESGGHGGADIHLVASLFPEKDFAFQRASAEDGYWSMAIGACANVSMADGNRWVDVPAP